MTIATHSAVSDLLAAWTEKFIQEQDALDVLVGSTNEFLDTATKEGLAQVPEALVEFFRVRGGKRGGPKVQQNKQKGAKKRGRWGCRDVRCNVYPVLEADPPNPNCPIRVIGNAAYIYPNKRAACLAAEQDANRQVPRGCVKRHCNCNTKCTKG